MEFSSTDFSEAEGGGHRTASVANTDLCSPLNEETKQTLQQYSCNPLMKQEKQWTSNELRLLREAVKNSVIEACIENFVDRQEILHSKILRAGVETSTEEVQRWKKEIEYLDQKIKQSSAELADLLERDLVDYSCVDWSMISAIDFKGTRSPAALECKWLNERNQWNNGPWTEQQLERLKQLHENKTFTSWTETNDWTDEEDERLVLGGNVLGRGGWEKYAEILPRQKPEGVRMPYRRLLSIILKLRSEKRSRFVCKISSAAVAAYKTRRDVMRQKPTSGGIQRRCYRHAKQQTEKNENATGSSRSAKKFKNGQQPPCVTDVVEDIDLTAKALNRLTITAEKPKRSCRHTGKVKNIKKDKHLRPNPLYEGTEFGPEVTETLSHQCVGAANSFKHFIPPPPGTTLPLTFTTTSAYRIFERARPSLTERASCYFPSRSENQTDADAFGMPNGNTRKFTAYDRLNIELHPSILGNHNYLKLKAQAREDLMRMVIDEEELLYEEGELGDVRNEVEITSTEQCRPIDCEESADDALTKTIETVIDRVCNRSTQRKKKRGKPSKKSQPFDILATSKKKPNLHEGQILPSGSTKRIRLALPDGSSPLDDNLNLDSNSSGDTSIRRSQQRQDSLGGSKICTSNVVPLRTVTEVQQVTNTLHQHCNDADLSNRKRRRSKKIVLENSAQEAQNVQWQSKRRKAL